jgi:hyperosmotically inducible protein
MRAIACLSAVLAMVGCEQKGPAEKAGERIDNATEKAGKDMDSAKSAVSEKVETTGEYIDDAAITARVKQALITDDILKASKIEVTTNNGVVRLSGTLDSAQLISKAVELVNGLKNVKSVQNELVFPVGVESK